MTADQYEAAVVGHISDADVQNKIARAKEVITAHEAWSNQWDNMRADTKAVIAWLESRGYMIDGRGPSTGLNALTGWNKDDSGYRSRNLDHAKSYSGYRPETGIITVIVDADIAQKNAKIEAKRAEYQAEIDKANARVAALSDASRPFDNWRNEHLARAIAENPADSVTIINGRKYHAEYRGKKYETYDAALSVATKDREYTINRYTREIAEARARELASARDSVSYWGGQLNELTA